MKNYDYWEKFVCTGKIDDYLNYIACTREEELEEFGQMVPNSKEGGFCAGINYCDGNGSVGHTGW
ncbi:MAG: hypothetical protein E7255_09475 [Lachnospiraceae bacterium]|jgi:hypothetical protein|nr:hypothetical protein [Lachnospiraceae bacterium]